MTIYPNLIIEALKNVRYPGTGKDIVSMGLVEDNIRIDGMNVTFSLLFEKPNDPTLYPCKANATARLAATVLLPTPPLPEDTAIIFFTCGNNLSGSGRAN